MLKNITNGLMSSVTFAPNGVDGNGSVDSSVEDMILGNLGMTDADFTDNSAADTGDDDVDNAGDQNNQQSDQSDRQPQRVTHTQQRAQQRQPQESAQNQFPNAEHRQTEVRPDAKGNLVDAQGRVVARAGAHARHYQTMVQERHRAQQFSTTNADLTARLDKAVEIGRDLYTRLNAYEAQETQIKELGLQPTDRLNAMQMYSELKSDPVAMVKKVLTGLAARGINIAQEFGTQSNGVDPKALMELISDKINEGIKPLRDRTEAERVAQQQQQATDRVNNQVARDTKDFFDRNPDAVPYLNVFTELYKRPEYRNWSLAELWVNIYKNRDKLSVSRAQNSRQRSLPNSRGQQPIRRNIDEAAPVGQSYQDIAKDVMAQYGIR